MHFRCDFRSPIAHRTLSFAISRLRNRVNEIFAPQPHNAVGQTIKLNVGTQWNEHIKKRQTEKENNQESRR